MLNAHTQKTINVLRLLTLSSKNVHFRDAKSYGEIMASCLSSGENNSHYPDHNNFRRTEIIIIISD